MDELRLILRKYYFSFVMVVFLLWGYQVKYLHNDTHWVTNRWVWIGLVIYGVVLVVWDVLRTYRLNRETKQIVQDIQTKRQKNNK